MFYFVLFLEKFTTKFFETFIQIYFQLTTLFLFHYLFPSTQNKTNCSNNKLFQLFTRTYVLPQQFSSFSIECCSNDNIAIHPCVLPLNIQRTSTLIHEHIAFIVTFANFDKRSDANAIKMRRRNYIIAEEWFPANCPSTSNLTTCRN